MGKGPSKNKVPFWTPADGHLRPLLSPKILEMLIAFLRFLPPKPTTASLHLTPRKALYFLTAPKRWLQRTWSVVIVVVFSLTLGMPWSLWFSPKVNLSAALSSPAWAHPLGTDNLGRDLLARTGEALLGAVLPLWCGVLAATLLGMGLSLIMICLLRRQIWRPFVAWFDLVAAGVVSIPVCLAAFAWAALRERAGLVPVIYTLSTVVALRTYLQLRDLYRQDEQLAYWTAHAALGGSLLIRLIRYGLCAAWTQPLAMSLGFHLRTAVAIEASLSYLGFGVQEPSPSFGNMLAAHFDLYLKGQWYVLVILVLGLGVTASLPQAVLTLSRGETRRPRVRYT